MGFDATFKRYFPAVLCLLLGIAAYFQASGMARVVASSVALAPSSSPVGPPLPVVTPHPISLEHATSAAPILARNPFDSFTGPLNDEPPKAPTPKPQQNDTKRDPYDDPPCDAAQVLLIATSDEPEWSFATLKSSDGTAMMRRKGDEFNGHTVYFIGDLRDSERRQHDPRDLWDRVWLTKSDSGRCQLQVGASAQLEAAPKPPRPSTSRVRPEIASKIHKVNATEFTVERSTVDSILESQAELMHSVGLVPEKEGDQIVGIRLFGIRSDSLLGSLGLENGDRLSRINGFDISEPQKALEAYAKLRMADHLTVSVNRRGKPMNIDFNIK